MIHNTDDSDFKYVNANYEDMNWGLYLNVAGFAHIPPNVDYPPSGHPTNYYFTWNKGRTLQEYQINYITEGKGVFENKSGRYTIQPGSLMIVKPGMWHRYKPIKKTGWKEHYIGFNGDVTSYIFGSNSYFFNQPVISIGFQEILVKLFYDIINLVKEEKAGYQKVCAGNIMLILGQIHSILTNKQFAGKGIERTIRKACMTFRSNLNSEINVEELAMDLNIGYSYFRRMFKRYTGVSPAQYHMNLRMQRARDLLISTDKRLQEIADDLGFESYFYFSRVFKQKNGISPSEYRTAQSRHTAV